jgi:hypothetical protein
MPPWSIEMSTMTDPGRMLFTISSVTSLGAFAPGTSTAPISKSASATAWAIEWGVEYIVSIRPGRMSLKYASRSRDKSRTVTRAPSPHAIFAAPVPAMPPPIMATWPGATPGSPPIRMPLPLLCFKRKFTPIWTDSLPAISLIGASSGREPFSSCTVSYAMAVTPESIRACVCSGSGAKCKYVNRTCPPRRYPYS